MTDSPDSSRSTMRDNQLAGAAVPLCSGVNGGPYDSNPPSQDIAREQDNPTDDVPPIPPYSAEERRMDRLAEGYKDAVIFDFPVHDPVRYKSPSGGSDVYFYFQRESVRGLIEAASSGNASSPANSFRCPHTRELVSADSVQDVPDNVKGQMIASVDAYKSREGRRTAYLEALTAARRTQESADQKALRQRIAAVESKATPEYWSSIDAHYSRTASSGRGVLDSIPGGTPFAMPVDVSEAAVPPTIPSISSDDDDDELAIFPRLLLQLLATMDQAASEQSEELGSTDEPRETLSEQEDTLRRMRAYQRRMQSELRRQEEFLNQLEGLATILELTDPPESSGTEDLGQTPSVPGDDPPDTEVDSSEAVIHFHFFDEDGNENVDTNLNATIQSFLESLGELGGVEQSEEASRSGSTEEPSDTSSGPGDNPHPVQADSSESMVSLSFPSDDSGNGENDLADMPPQRPHVVSRTMREQAAMPQSDQSQPRDRIELGESPEQQADLVQDDVTRERVNRRGASLPPQLEPIATASSANSGRKVQICNGQVHYRNVSISLMLAFILLPFLLGGRVYIYLVGQLPFATAMLLDPTFPMVVANAGSVSPPAHALQTLYGKTVSVATHSQANTCVFRPLCSPSFANETTEVAVLMVQSKQAWKGTMETPESIHLLDGTTFYGAQHNAADVASLLPSDALLMQLEESKVFEANLNNSTHNIEDIDKGFATFLKE